MQMHSKCGGLHGHHGPPILLPSPVPVSVCVFFDRMQRNHTKKVAKLRVASLSTLVGAIYSKFNYECIVKIKNVNSYLNALIFESEICFKSFKNYIWKAITKTLKSKILRIHLGATCGLSRWFWAVQLNIFLLARQDLSTIDQWGPFVFRLVAAHNPPFLR